MISLTFIIHRLLQKPVPCLTFYKAYAILADSLTVEDKHQAVLARIEQNFDNDIESLRTEEETRQETGDNEYV